MNIFITVKKNGVAVYDGDDDRLDRSPIALVRNTAEWNQLIDRIGEDGRIAFSSSMDFPNEYTEDSDVLALVGALMTEAD